MSIALFSLWSYSARITFCQLHCTLFLLIHCWDYKAKLCLTLIYDMSAAFIKDAVKMLADSVFKIVLKMFEGGKEVIKL